MAKPQHRAHNGAAEAVELPEGWVPTTLGEVCDLNPSKPPRDFLAVDAPVTFVPMAAVDAPSGTIAAAEVRPFASVRKGFTSFRNGDVIMAKITPCAENGKAAVAADLQNGIGFGSTEFHVLRPSQAVLPEYVYHFIRQESFRDAAAAEMTGTVGQKRVPAWFLEHAFIPLPPLAEQKRIVAEIDALFARVDAARERLAKVPSILKRFRQSVLAAACSGRLTSDWRESHPGIEPSSELLRRITGRAGFQSRLELPEIPDCWVWAALPWLGELNRGKSRHRPRNASHLFGGPYPFIQTGDVARSGGRIRSHSQTYSEEGLKQSRLWPAGTVCITIAANIADSGILTYKACFPDSVVGFIADSRLCSPEFVEFFIRTARENLSAFAPETTQKNINLEILREVAVPVAPLKEQGEIVRRVEVLFKLADAIEKRIAAATARAEKLNQSILAKAFRGELVPSQPEADSSRALMVQNER